MGPSKRYWQLALQLFHDPTHLWLYRLISFQIAVAKNLVFEIAMSQMEAELKFPHVQNSQSRVVASLTHIARLSQQCPLETFADSCQTVGPWCPCFFCFRRSAGPAKQFTTLPLSPMEEYTQAKTRQSQTAKNKKQWTSLSIAKNGSSTVCRRSNCHPVLKYFPRLPSHVCRDTLYIKPVGLRHTGKAPCKTFLEGSTNIPSVVKAAHMLGKLKLPRVQNQRFSPRHWAVLPQQGVAKELTHSRKTRLLPK